MEKTHKEDNTYSGLKSIVLFHPLLYPCLFFPYHKTGSVLRGSKMCLITTFSRPSKLTECFSGSWINMFVMQIVTLGEAGHNSKYNAEITM